MLYCFVHVLLQFLKGIQFQRVAPRVYGACGRLVIVEHGGRLLSSYLNESFAERAEFALQLLSMVQVFWVRNKNIFHNFQYFLMLSYFYFCHFLLWTARMSELLE